MARKETNLPQELINVWADQDRELRASWSRGEVRWETVASADVDHSIGLERCVTKLGWRALFDGDRSVSDDAWLIVQHSNRRPEFQKRCLTEWKSTGLLPDWQVAFLEDRVALAEGRPQVFGSQVQRRPDGTWRLWPTTARSETELDSIRRDAGLPPIGAYFESVTGQKWTPNTPPDDIDNS